MVDFENKSNYTVYDLKKLIEMLRSPEGCPWDREQTHESIRRNLLEEAYEAAEAIDMGDAEYLREELGDVLMQVVFHSDMEEKAGNFTLDDVADTACKKLIRRHPHIFGDGTARNSREVLQSWESIKSEEKRHKNTSDDMQSVARSLPALWRAEKIQEKAAKEGFDWPDHTGALASVESELYEIKDAIASGEDISDELGDLIFSAVNLARFFQIDPEQALGQSCDKFIDRFSKVEEKAGLLGRTLKEMSLEEMDLLYEQAKSEECNR